MKKRVLTWMLAVLILAGCLTGCGDQESTVDTNDPASEGQNASAPTPTGLAYQASYYPLEIDYPINYMNNVCKSGSYLFFTADYATGETVDEYDWAYMESYSYEATENGLFRIDLTTYEVTKLDGYESYAIPEGMQGSSYVTNISAGSEGTVWLCESIYTYYYDLPEDFEYGVDDASIYYTPGERGTRMSQYDTDGNLLTSFELEVGEDVYLDNVYTDTNNYSYTTDWTNVYLFDGEGTLVGTLPNENYGNLVRYSDTQIGIRSWTDDGKTYLSIIDPETQSLGEEIELSSNAYNLVSGNEEYQYIYNLNGVIYGHKEGAEEDEKLLSFMDCDINISDLSYYDIQEDGTVIALESDTSSGSQGKFKFSLIRMDLVDAATLPQKQELTLACLYLGYDLRTEVISFNRASSDVRITVKDYSQYNSEDDWNAGLTKLNTEILSGASPDILLVDSSMPLKQYAAKGIVLDLWELIDSDPELSRDDLMTHFLDALSVDGKLCQVTDNFSIQTAVGLTAVVGDQPSWTLDEMLAAKESLGPDATIFGVWDTKSGILENCLSRSLDAFVDWSNSASPCSFDSPGFIEMLEFANSFPAEFNSEDFDWDLYENENVRIRTGKQLLQTAYLSSLDSIKYTKADLGGESVNYIGYPSSNGSGSTFSTYNGLAIFSSCKNVDAAWSFVRTRLTEEHQITDYMYQFPTNRHAFDTMVERAMTPEYTTDPETGEQVEVTMDWWVDDNTTVQIGALSEEEYNEFLRLYEACSTVYSYDEAIMNIIKEEVEPYFNGQKTVEETARLIQDRVGLYVMEQS